MIHITCITLVIRIVVKIQNYDTIKLLQPHVTTHFFRGRFGRKWKTHFFRGRFRRKWNKWNITDIKNKITVF